MIVFFTNIGVQLFRLLPFRAIYILSDFLYFLFKYILKYRKKTIEQNLRNSFPEKSDTDIAFLIDGAYRNLCDVFVEGVKGLSMSEKTFRERYKIKNPEILDEFFANGKSVIMAGGHYTNWEWGVTSWSLWFRHKVIGIYKPLTSKDIEAFLNKKRSVFGMYLAATYDTRKAIETHEGEACMYVLFGDQSPSNMKTTYWLRFLNQDTAWLHGVGTFARNYDFSIYYLDTQRVTRGFYESILQPLVLNPKEKTAEEISQIYASHLEAIILKKPEDWLWSHKRWKHKKTG